jgi:predicted nucleic acid-binding protein
MPSRPPGGGASTSQGHPRTIFRRALERDNLVLAEVTAREIGRARHLKTQTADTNCMVEPIPLRSYAASLFDANDIGLCAPVRLELLYSARSRSDYRAFATDLAEFPDFALVEHAALHAESIQAGLGERSGNRGPRPIDLLQPSPIFTRSSSSTMTDISNRSPASPASPQNGWLDPAPCPNRMPASNRP